jgi:hypothetical protein
MEDRFFEILRMFKKGNNAFQELLEKKYPAPIVEHNVVTWDDVREMREPFMLAKNVISTPTFDKEDISFDVLFVDDAYLAPHKHPDCKERVKVMKGEGKLISRGVELIVIDIIIPAGVFHGFYGKKGTILKVTFTKS